LILRIVVIVDTKTTQEFLQKEELEIFVVILTQLSVRLRIRVVLRGEMISTIGDTE
jgi:hypothetical protein